MMKLAIVLGGVLVGGLLWIGLAIRRKWAAPFDDIVPPLKRVLQADPRERMWNHERWQ